MLPLESEKVRFDSLSSGIGKEELLVPPSEVLFLSSKTRAVHTITVVPDCMHGPIL